MLFNWKQRTAFNTLSKLPENKKGKGAPIIWDCTETISLLLLHFYAVVFSFLSYFNKTVVLEERKQELWHMHNTCKQNNINNFHCVFSPSLITFAILTLLNAH